MLSHRGVISVELNSALSSNHRLSVRSSSNLADSYHDIDHQEKFLKKLVQRNNGNNTKNKRVSMSRSDYPHLLDSWELHYRRLIDEKGDDNIRDKINYYHQFANFILHDRVIYVWLIVCWYYAICYLAIIIYCNRVESQIMFYLTHLLLFKGAYYCIITVKGRLFGGLTDQYDDHHSIGYYELLDVKYRYLYAQRDLVRMMKKSIIAGKLNSEYVENPIIQGMLFYSCTGSFHLNDFYVTTIINTSTSFRL
jgi:hypothetical protein